MGYDVGKSAKHMGRDHPRIARSIDQDPIRVAPHKKPKRYRLEVCYETVTTERMSKEFTTKADMQAFRLRVEQRIAEKKKAKPRYSTYDFASWRSSYELKMDSEECTKLKSEPVFTETLIE